MDRLTDKLFDGWMGGWNIERSLLNGWPDLLARRFRMKTPRAPEAQSVPVQKEWGWVLFPPERNEGMAG